MKLKRGVDQSDVKHQIWFAIGFVDAVTQALDLGEAVVTSLRDGTHSVNSLHYKGLAADFRTRDFTPEAQKALQAAVHEGLNPRGYDVLLESDHLHVEFDPKVSEVFAKETT